MTVAGKASSAVKAIGSDDLRKVHPPSRIKLGLFFHRPGAFGSMSLLPLPIITQIGVSR